MKKILLAMLFVGAVGQAQTTHMVNWFFGVPSSQTTLTIQSGDTVMWMWTDATMPHTVTSLGSAVETFNSGTITGAGSSFEHTFTAVGANPYRCIFHSGMTGTITVTALSTPEVRQDEFKFYPNPVTDYMTISSPVNIGRVTVVDLTGKTIIDMTAGTPEVVVHFENFPTGQYWVKAETASGIRTFSVVRK